jgi:Protein of unknown function (DUF2778)
VLGSTTPDSQDGGLLIRVSAGTTAAGVAAFAIGFISYVWLTPDTGSAVVESSADARIRTAFSSIDSQSFDSNTTTVASVMPNVGGFKLSSLETGDDSDSAPAFNEPEPPEARSAFGERFAFDQYSPRGWSLASFNDRFAGEGLGQSASVQTEPLAPRTIGPRIAAAAVTSQPAPRSVVARATPPAAPKRTAAPRMQLASASDTALPLGYAPTDSVKSGITGSLGSSDSNPLGDIDTSHTAIYDISARTVYLPNGRRLEAHSGLGDHMDDVRYVKERGTGPTPPNVYDLRMRESLFHGVRAIRLVPTNESKMYGRAGILAHSYMLGPNGQSNGCVSFSDYSAFLEAFQRGDINRIVVVERLADAPPAKSPAEWFANTFKDMFRRS